MRNYKLLKGLFLVGLLITASYLRLYKVSEYMTFLGDEGRDVLVVKRMLVDHIFTLLGPTASVGGFFLGPIYYYFMLPFLWLWKLDPTGPAVMVAIFGIATTYLIYRIGNDLFDPLVGMIAASLYTVSPLIIAHSRSSWNPNLVPFFSALLYMVVRKISIDKSYNYFFWIGIIIGIGLQLHYLFLFLVCSVLVWVLIYFRNTKMIRYFMFALAGFLIAYSPFIIFELRHGFPNSIAFIKFLQQGKDTGFSLITFTSNISDVTFRSFARLLFRYPTSNAFMMLSDTTKIMWNSLIISSIGLSIIYVFLSFANYLKEESIARIKYFRSNNSKKLVLLVLWFVIPILLFGFYRRAIYDYYLGIIFPVPFLLIGAVISKLYSFRWGSIFAAIIWFALLVFNWQGRPFIFPPNNQLGQTKKIAGEALRKSEGKPFNFALITGSNSDHAYRYFFEISGNKPVILENSIVDPDRKTVTDQLIVICEISDCQPLGHSLWEVAGFGRADIESETNNPDVGIKIFKLVHYKEG